jgi:hypothetical protein
MDQQQLDRVIKEVLSAKDEDLSKHERRLRAKYLNTNGQVGALKQDIQNSRSQIEQAQARLRSLELQLQAETGRAAGFLESLVSLRLEEDESDSTESAPALAREVVEEPEDATEESAA